MKRLLSAATLVATLASSPSWAQDADPFAELRRTLERKAAAREFAGVVAVARDGEDLFNGAFGMASLELDVPHAVDTRFKLHSLSKPLTAALVLRSVDAERLDLEAPVGEYLPDWPLEWSEVTVRHLANHTSGLPDFAEEFLSGWRGSAAKTWESLAPKLGSRAQAAEPGSRWAYSNAGYVLLAAVLENAWEAPFATVLEERLSGPAGMGSTELETTPPWDSISYDGHRIYPRLACGYNGSPDALQVAHSKMYSIPGAGGIVTDAGDLMAFTQALFHGDLLSPESLEAMTTVLPGQSMPYALGWVVKERDGAPLYVHDGGNNGFVTSLEYDAGRRLTVVILCNLGYTPMGALRDDVADQVLAALD